MMLLPVTMITEQSAGCGMLENLFILI